MHVDPEGLDSLKDLPHPARGLCHYFREGEGYVAVMADEVLEAARKVDWDAALAYCRRLRELRTFFEVVVELRGIVPQEEALEEYYVLCPDGIRPAQRALDELYDAAVFDEAGLYMLDVDGQVYLLHYELMWEWFAEQGMDSREGSTYVEGDLGELLEGLLRQQRGKEPRPVLREMLGLGSLYDWEERQPPSIAMRDFLDAHVPDARDDYFFADKVVEELINELRWGMVKGSVQACFDILANNDFEPDESQINPLVGLWTNMCNGLPNWPNNGWAPNELMQRTSRRPVFFNPDGSIMKVGRNDPCPCGSGKKYKRCCGRS